MKYTIIGTAGHIDHGKSALVKALTGTDPDRLAEEHERGMTIDIGFAFLNDYIAIIDVPGHERFIKNMVAGVSTIDMVVLVIAADDGIMPQTREHLDILTLLQLKHGIIAITKKDLVDDEWLEIVKEETANLVKGTFLQHAPVKTVSSVTGEGINDLSELIKQTANKIESRKDRGLFWMPVDRSFSIKGFGTVVTGSVLSGQVSPGDTVELLPRQKKIKIRGIQTHGKAAENVRIGERGALNLANISKDDIQRGDVLASINQFTPSNIIDVQVNLLKNAKKALNNRSRVRVHIGTREIIARIKLLDKDKLEPGTGGFAQLQLEDYIVSMRRDPIVIRQYSPLITIGGGIILDTNPKPHRRFHQETLDHLKSLEKQDPVDVILTVLLSQKTSGLRIPELEKLTGYDPNNLQNILTQPSLQKQILKLGPDKNPVYCHRIIFEKLKENIINTITAFHKREPFRPGMNKAELKIKSTNNSSPLFENVLTELVNEGTVIEDSNLVKLSTYRITLSEKDKTISAAVRDTLISANFSPPSVSELAQKMNISVEDTQRILGAMYGMGDIIWLDNEIFFHKQILEKAKKLLISYLLKNSEITISQYRDQLNTTRKFALALLLYFDSRGLTTRVEDVRIINDDKI
ncbi:selenocysteine-specific translation elongation factor [candidate division KSB1 bacterium]|nr:selenocysteine-specific translation elongation factor [candidate division KSB1 bacterium]